PLILLPFIIISIMKVNISKLFLMTLSTLGFFVVIYSIVSINYGYYSIVSILGKVVFPLLLFIFGYIVAGLDTSKNQKSFFIMLVLVIGSVIFGAGSLGKSISIYGSFENVMRSQGGRFIQDLWGNNFLTATVLNASVSLGLPIV